VTGFSDPAAAHEALLTTQNVALLITRVRLGDGRWNGFSLSIAGRTRNPAMKVLFVALPDYQSLARDLGEFLAVDASLETIIAKAESMLPPEPGGAGPSGRSTIGGVSSRGSGRGHRRMYRARVQSDSAASRNARVFATGRK
jgi:hypothetical protein